ncbi:MAG TPA: PQQ-binding-like beta-propeller repeat protein, partial [Longimicrobium sp.]|nr:PQQ-binding-like beta-propeller repeat protein [Longimicrobium sp.]
ASPPSPMNRMERRRLARPLCALTLAALAACPPAGAGGGAAPETGPRPVGPTAAQMARLPMRFEVVGRGVVTHTRTTDVVAFRGQDGKDYAITGTFGGCIRCVGDRVYVWDVSDPARPVVTDSVRVDARAINDVAVNATGTLAAIARRGAESRRNGVVLLDLSTPAHPTILSEYWETLTGGVQAVFIDGTRLYAADVGGGDLAILDISDPRDPKPHGRWGVPQSPDRYLNEVFVRDGLAYLAYWDDGLVILDVGNGIKGGTPRLPRLVSQVRYRTEYRNLRHGNTHYVFPYTNRAGRRYVFVADEILPDNADFSRRIDIGGLLHVFDARNLEAPTEVATYEVPDRGINKFWVENDTLYVGTNNGGLRAVDVGGELRGNLQGREVAVLATGAEQAYVPNLTMTWAAMPYNGLVFATDFNSGLWVTRLAPAER